MNKPSRRFSQATNFIHPNLRDVVLVGVVARGRISAFEPRSPHGRRRAEPCRSMEGLFESLLAESFGGGT
jgi:hypothetical protein